MSVVQLVALADIRTDSGAQMRQGGTDPATVAQYAEDLREGATFPPIIVFSKDGAAPFHLADGWHRLAAHRENGAEEISAEVRSGGARDAILAAAGANAQHGLPRSQADKRRAVERVLQDPDWMRWSNRQIGTACRCDHKTVARIRRELNGEIPTERIDQARHGNVAGMKTAEIRKTSDATITIKFLTTLSDEALRAECERRGWEVVLP